MKSPDIDNILDTLGKPGKLQILSFFFLCVNLWVVMANHMSSAFFAAKTEFSCKLETNITSSYVLPLVKSNGEVQADDCFVLKGNNSKKNKCSNWTYHLVEGETTITSEFDLVCDDAYKSDLATTIYFAGVMIGGIVFGMLADKYGRKRVVILTLLLSGIVGVATFILRTFAAFIILRFFLGFFMQGVQNSSFVLALEIISMKYRAHCGLLFSTSGGVGILLLVFLSYVIKDWKYVQLCTGLLPFLSVPMSWFVPESLRWHIVQKNFIPAEAIIKRIATFNGLPFPRQLFDELKDDALKVNRVQDKHKANIINVFKSPKLRKISFILFLMWFTLSAGYYGLAFHISFLFGNKYLNFAISTLLDVTAMCSLLWLVPRYGRRRPLIIVLFVCAVANALCSVIASQSAVSGAVKLLGTTMAIIGKSGFACGCAIGYVFTSELYPTVVRNVSLGLNTFWTRVGGMAAPQIFFLGIYSSAFVPYTILTVLTLTSGFFIFLLPETRNKGFTDRLEISMSSCGEEDGVINLSDSGNKMTQSYETSL